MLKQIFLLSDAKNDFKKMSCEAKFDGVKHYERNYRDAERGIPQ